MSEVFGDMISQEGLKGAKNKTRSLRNSYYKLENEVENANIGLEKLINMVKRTQDSMYDTTDPDVVESVKREMDKIAYLIEDFVKDFKPIYEEVINRYMIEEMSGTFEKKHSDNQYGFTESVPRIYNPNVGWDQNSN